MILASCATAAPPEAPDGFCKGVLTQVRAPVGAIGMRTVSIELIAAETGGRSQARMQAEPDDAAAREFWNAFQLLSPGRDMHAAAEAAAVCLASGGFEKAGGPALAPDGITHFRNSKSDQRISMSASPNGIGIIVGKER